MTGSPIVPIAADRRECGMGAAGPLALP